MTVVATAATAATAASATATAEGLSPMQRELLSRADTIFATIGSAVSSATDAAMRAGAAVAREIPDIAWQYIAYGRVWHTVMTLLGIIALVYGIYAVMFIAFKNCKNYETNGYNWHTMRVTHFVAGAFSGFFGLVTIVGHAKDMVLVWAAPKLWLILELVVLVKKVKG